MPDEAYWNSLFDIPGIINWLELKSRTGQLVEFGCGYGTFTVPVAEALNGAVISFDIDP